MTAPVSKLLSELEQHIANHSIYVWGGRGQLCKEISESWIRKKEASNSGGKYADIAVRKWREVMTSPYRDVARAFDCSGYVSFCLVQIGATDKRRDCDGIYDRCKPVELTDAPQNGTLLFRASASNQNDETHVGVYWNGKQYHAKGREEGVVAERYKPRDWSKAGWFIALEEDQSEPVGTVTVIKVKGSVKVRKGNGTFSTRIGTAKNCELPFLGQAQAYPNWYMTMFDGQNGYISSNPKYTELLTK